MDGERPYLVKWVGFEELTEEPPEHLEAASEMVGQYWATKMGDLPAEDASDL